MDHPRHRRTRRPRPAATAAPLRRLAPAAPAARPHQRRRHHPRPGRRRPAARPSRDRAARLAHRPRPHPGHRPQDDLDTWLASDAATHRREAGHFVRWAKKQKLTSLEFPAIRWGGPTGVIDTEARWDQARRLLHDDTVKPEDRVAGLLVLLYAQWPATISRLTLDHVHASDEQVRLRLGREPVVLPEPLAALSCGSSPPAAATPPSATTEPRPGCSPADNPDARSAPTASPNDCANSASAPARSRSTALFQLATDLPAAMLARMLGIHITVAVAWQRASAGDWTTYAADVSRRTAR